MTEIPAEWAVVPKFSFRQVPGKPLAFLNTRAEAERFAADVTKCAKIKGERTIFRPIRSKFIPEGIRLS